MPNLTEILTHTDVSGAQVLLLNCRAVLAPADAAALAERLVLAAIAAHRHNVDLLTNLARRGSATVH